MRTHVYTLAALVTLLTVAGCGGMKFARTDNATRYRGLPLGTEVKHVGSDLQLPQPVAEIGILTYSEQGDAEPDPSKVSERFLKHAARYGCDAVVGLAATTRSTKIKRKKKKIGEGGKVGYVSEEDTQYSHDWRARCVRSSKAPGGLAEGSGSVAEMPANALPVVPVPPRRTRKEAARDADPIAEGVWRKLAVFKHPYLTAWAPQLNEPAPAAGELLECLNELMVQVSGPTGFWRKTVPIEWLGCQVDPGSKVCGQAVKASKALAPYDRLQKSLLRVSRSSAKGFLAAHKKQIEAYLDEVVPLQPSMSGMKTTEFYKQHFK